MFLFFLHLRILGVFGEGRWSWIPSLQHIPLYVFLSLFLGFEKVYLQGCRGWWPWDKPGMLLKVKQKLVADNWFKKTMEKKYTHIVTVLFHGPISLLCCLGGILWYCSMVLTYNGKFPVKTGNELIYFLEICVPPLPLSKSPTTLPLFKISSTRPLLACCNHAD